MPAPVRAAKLTVLQGFGACSREYDWNCITVAAPAPALCVTLAVSAPERALLPEPSCSRPTVSDVPAAFPTSEKVPPPITSTPVAAGRLPEFPSRSRIPLFVTALSSVNVPPLNMIDPAVCRSSDAVPASRSVTLPPTAMSFSMSSVPLTVCTAVPRTMITPVACPALCVPIFVLLSVPA